MSISVLVSAKGKFDFLVTGDLIGRKHGNENAMLEGALGGALSKRAEGVDIEVLRVGHHGAANATSPDFVKKLKPEIALISVGANNHGHPHCETLQTLKDLQFVIPTSGKFPENCDDNLPTNAPIANGTIRIDIQGERFTVGVLRDTHSGKKSLENIASCSVSRACKWLSL